MICCLNPTCQQPQNPDDAQVCNSCGAELIPLLRGRYRVIQTLGQGGFGRTYLALDEDRLKARSVIKQFSPQFHGTKSLDKAIEMFAQEAMRLHELGEHPQIPTLLAYFEHNQRLYLVQEFVEGQNLAQELQRQGLFNEQKIRELLLGVLPVLKFIHDRQVIHRDITPTNIMRRQNDGRLMLIDFGVSKQLTNISPIMAGTRIGTEGFSPMEQLRGGRAFPASDLYSLGAICIYLLTQTHPNDLYDPLSGKWIWREALNRKGNKISDRLGQILDKLLQDLVADRYQSVDEVLKDLNLIVSSPPVLPDRPPAHPPVPAPPLPRSQTFTAPPVSRPPVLQSAFRPLVSKPQTASWACVHTFVGHPSWVTSVSISPDQSTLASGSLDDTIKIWSLQTGELLRTLTGHARGINCLAFSPTSRMLVSGSDDDTLRLWNYETGESLRALTEHSRDINAVAISADGKILVSGSEDRTVRLWNLPEGTLISTFFGPGAMIKTVAISPDGQTVASGGLDNKIKLWSMKTGELIRTFSGHFNSVMAIAITRDGQALVSASKDKTVRVWNLATAEILHTLTGHSDVVNTVIFSPDGQTIISGSSDKTIKIWNRQDGQLLHTLTGHIDSVNSVAVSADGQSLVSGSKDKTIKIWQTST